MHLCERQLTPSYSETLAAKPCTGLQPFDHLKRNDLITSKACSGAGRPSCAVSLLVSSSSVDIIRVLLVSCAVATMHLHFLLKLLCLCVARAYYFAHC
jgi:hypothetical protein